MHSLPNGTRPHATKSTDDHGIERAFLEAQAEAFDARTGHEALRETLADGHVSARLADAMWPAVEALRRSARAPDLS